MHKAIRLAVTLWIEADDEPAHDFARATIEAVQDMLADGATRRPDLLITVEKIVEDRSPSQDTAEATPSPSEV